MTNTLASYWRFFVAAVTKQAQTGSVMPSQRFLIDRMIAPVPEDYRGELVELGAGTGALTMRLAARCPHARIVACEINPDLAHNLRHRLHLAGLSARVKVVCGSAETLLAQVARRATGRPDFIISGIPLGNLAKSVVMSLLNDIRQALASGGMYIQFQYSLIDRKKVKACFSTLRTTPALLNFPPAVVYYAEK